MATKTVAGGRAEAGGGGHSCRRPRGRLRGSLTVTLTGGVQWRAMASPRPLKDIERLVMCCKSHRVPQGGMAPSPISTAAPTHPPLRHQDATSGCHDAVNRRPHKSSNLHPPAPSHPSSRAPPPLLYLLAHCNLGAFQGRGKCKGCRAAQLSVDCRWIERCRAAQQSPQSHHIRRPGATCQV